MAEYLNAYDDGAGSVDTVENVDNGEDAVLKHENDQRMKNRDEYVEYYNVNDNASVRYKKYQEIYDKLYESTKDLMHEIDILSNKS